MKFVLAILALLTCGAAWADFAAGAVHRDAGRFDLAAAVWEPLAQAGDARAQVALGVLYGNEIGRASCRERV